MGLWKYQGKVYTSEEMKHHILWESGEYEAADAALWRHDDVLDIVFDMQVRYLIAEPTSDDVIPLRLTGLSPEQVKQKQRELYGDFYD